MTTNRDKSIKMKAEWTEALELTDKHMETNTTISHMFKDTQMPLKRLRTCSDKSNWVSEIYPQWYQSKLYTAK